ncbi:methionine--tRNA ligase [Methanobrevibacter sp. 87.7]|uniref:methionine--tRNA ligase n=1 Tax=Methanobrevibacter sp. 87.7 TaxID=387957 RepID=UPI000B50B915|nr:methionine--tRNA ligase [Methanobrevibacter sp. 87.7]OWT33343.1 methionine--tRNA ligase [Methanobrevibacter sp. 87.7]
MAKIFVSTALPYANGPFHLGHLRSTYLPADIFCRYHRMIGDDVLMVGATDEHGTPIAVQADKEGKKPIEIATRYHDMIVRDIKSCNISLDNFSRTTKPLHYKISQDFFTYLYEHDYIYKKTVEQLYCPNCKKFLPDRYVEGICPVCGGEARGDHCENCGRALETTELEEPRCLTCNSTPIIKETTQYYFKLSEFQDQVSDYINNNDMLADNVKNYAKNWLKDGLKDWVYTRDMDWGIPVPLEEAKGKVIYVWGEAFIGYISSAAEWTRKGNPAWEDYWNDTVVHFIGKDIIYHHSIFWIAMLIAHGCKLPDDIFAGEFLSLEGRKMSTSKNWVVWVDDFVKKYDADLLRYYLTIVAPLNKDTDFSWDDFQRRNNDELADVLGNFLHRTFTFTNKFFNGEIPEYKNPSDDDLAFIKLIKETPDKVGEKIKNMEFREGLVEIMKTCKAANKYFNDQEPWKAVKEDKQKAANCLYLSNQLCKSLATLLKPYIPTKADKIAEIMNIELHDDWNEASEFVEEGHKINKAKPLFKKIDDKEIAKEKEELYKNLEETEDSKKDDKKDDNMSDIISIDDFDKIDLRIGQIKEAEKIEKSRKLLKLQVDLGTETKQIVSGIANEYKPEDLIDRKVVVLCNLKPAKLCGEKSEGMILATEKAAALLGVHEDCEVGEKVM